MPGFIKLIFIILCRDVCVPGCVCAWMFVCREICMPRWLCAGMFVCLDVCVPGCLCAWMFVCLDVYVPGCLSAGMFVCWDVCLPGCLCAWMFVCLDVWVLGCLCAWMFMCLDVCQLSVVSSPLRSSLFYYDFINLAFIILFLWNNNHKLNYFQCLQLPCYSPDMYIYNLRSHKWISQSILKGNIY